MTNFFRKTNLFLSLGFLGVAFFAASVVAQASDKPKMATEMPEGIMAPAEVKTRIGTLRTKDGFPDKATIDKVYDNLDFQRGVQSMLFAMPGASLVGMRRGLREFGPDNQTVVMFDEMMDSRTLFLTANTTTIYNFGWLNTKKGPLVIEIPPGMLGAINDSWFRYVADLGVIGPDKGKGGKYLVLPPGYKDDVPTGYFVVRPKTFWSWAMVRGSTAQGLERAVDLMTAEIRIYPLALATKPPKTEFIDTSGISYNTVSPNDFSFYEDVNRLIQKERSTRSTRRPGGWWPPSASSRASRSSRLPGIDEADDRHGPPAARTFQGIDVTANSRTTISHS